MLFGQDKHKVILISLLNSLLNFKGKETIVELIQELTKEQTQQLPTYLDGKTFVAYLDLGQVQQGALHATESLAKQARLKPQTLDAQKQNIDEMIAKLNELRNSLDLHGGVPDNEDIV